MKRFSSTLILVCAISAIIGCGKPDSYDECILTYVKEGMSERAVYEVVRSCKNMFAEEKNAIPRGQTEDRDLTDAELSNLTGRAGLGVGVSFGGTIYNGNANLIITEIEIALKTGIGREEVYRTYRDKVSIEPSTTGKFRVDIIPGDHMEDYDWYLSRAKGRPTE